MHMQFHNGSLQQVTAVLYNRVIIGSKNMHEDLKNLHLPAMLIFEGGARVKISKQGAVCYCQAQPA